MLGGLLGGLIGGVARRAISRPVGIAASRTGALSGLADGGDEGRRVPRGAMSQQNARRIGPAPAPPQSQPQPQPTAQAQADSPGAIGSSLLQGGPQPQQATPESQPSVGPQQPSERPIEPLPGGEQAQSPVIERQQPIDPGQLDITQGVRPPEIGQQLQQIPPPRNFPIPNSMPAVHPRASGDETPDMGFGFKRHEGIEDYAAKFTYRRR